jgi:tetratricopeptide (TPR) repeat protein
MLLFLKNIKLKISVFCEKLASNPKKTNKISRLIRKALTQQSLDKAHSLFKELILRLEHNQRLKSNRPNIFLLTDEEKNAWYHLIRATLKDENFAATRFLLEQSLLYFQQKLVTQPDNSRLLLEIGKIHLYYSINLYDDFTHSHLDNAILYLEKTRTHSQALNPTLLLQTIEALSEAYFYKRMYKEARSLLEYALTEKISSETLFLLLAKLLEESGHYEQAISYYDQAIQLNPSSTARFLKTYPLLAQGKFELAWKCHQTRGRATHWKPPSGATQWTGEPLQGKTLLLYSEGGVGDELYYLAPIPDLLSLVDRCILTCDPRHQNLFRNAFPGVDIRPFSRRYQKESLGLAVKDSYSELLKTLPKVDYYCMIGDLSLYFRNTLQSFHNQKSYLIAASDKLAYWRQHLDKLGREFKVGICWSSGYMALYREREYTQLQDWLPVLKIPGVAFINLMYNGITEFRHLKEQDPSLNLYHLDGIDLKDDFDNLAALIMSLDLVISVDTNIAELSGALGQRIWRVINSPYLANHCRIWPNTRQDMWHPSMIQINSEPIGNTENLIMQIRDRLIQITSPAYAGSEPDMT